MLYIDIVFLTAVCYNGFVARSCMGEGRALQVSEGLKGASGMIQVVKRDGENAEFSLNKITEAIKKAFKATKKDYNNEILELLSLRVTADFQDKMKEGMISVEEIQDSVEHVLEQTGYTDVAKAYILYRKQREKIRNMNSTILDYKDVVNSYVKVEDWRVKENSTVTYSVGGLILSNSGAVTARLPKPTAMLTSISTTCPCLPVTVPDGP